MHGICPAFLLHRAHIYNVASGALIWLLSPKVWPASSSSSVENLQSVVENTVAQLQQQRLLTGETLGQMFKSVSDILNKGSSEDQKGAKEEVRMG